MIDPTTGLLLLPARSYDPGQGRFTTRDTANVFNKYQAFSTNPIINVDPTGHFSLTDLLIDIGTFLMFAVATVVTGGAALAAVPAIVGAEVGAVAASTIVTAVAGAVTAFASAAGATASALKMADDIDDAVSGKHFLTNDQRSQLGTVQMVAGAIAAVGGIATVGATAAGAIADSEGVVADISEDSWDYTDDSYSEPSEPSQFAPGEASERRVDPLLYSDEEIHDEWSELRSRLGGRANDSSRWDEQAASDSEGDLSEGDIADEADSESEDEERDILRTALGRRAPTMTDQAITNRDIAVRIALRGDEAATKALNDQIRAAIYARAMSSTLRAFTGNSVVETDLLGSGSYLDKMIQYINIDNRSAVSLVSK